MRHPFDSKHWPCVRRIAVVVGTALSVAAVATGTALPLLAKMIWG